MTLGLDRVRHSNNVYGLVLGCEVEIPSGDVSVIQGNGLHLRTGSSGKLTPERSTMEIIKSMKSIRYKLL